MSSSGQSESEVESEPGSGMPEKLEKVEKQPKTANTKVLVEKRNKKLSTKEMIIFTLSESKSRKGMSLYAIKKQIQDKYNVDTEKIKYLIKKNINESVEAGTIIRTKGIGASGSFRLAPGSKQPKKPLKAPKKPLEAPKKILLTPKKPLTVPKKPKEATEKEEKPKKSSSKNVEEDSKPKKKVAKIKTVKGDSKESKKIKTLTNMESPKPGTSSMKTSKKKSRNMMKRKSIGSIVKPPKMRPVKAK